MSLVTRNMKIAKMRSSGEYTLQEIATLYGLTRERIRQICIAMKVDCIIVPPKVSRQLTSHIMQDLACGHAVGIVARANGVTPHTVSKYAVIIGLTLSDSVRRVDRNQYCHHAYVARLWNTGMTIKQLSSLLDKSVHYIATMLQRSRTQNFLESADMRKGVKL